MILKWGMLSYDFHTDDTNLRDLAQRYWASDAAGGWIETTEVLATAKNVPKHQIIKHVNGAVTVYLQSVSCSCCGSLAKVSNRTEYRKLISISSKSSKQYTCAACLLKMRDAEIQRKKDLETAKKQQIEAVLDEIAGRQFDFSTLSFVDAVYCHLIRQAAGLDAESPAFDTQNLFIVPNASKRTGIFKQLFAKGILTISHQSPISAFGVGDGGVTYSPEQVFWTFATDVNGFDSSVVTQFIYDAIEKADAEALSNLWHEIAQQECEAYFYELCERYRFSNWAYTDSVAESIDYVLQKFSIPQVWGLMYNEFKNLAALVQAGTYNKRHIENMFSGNMRRRSDRWIANNWDAKPWSRRPFEKESYLTSFLFDNLFGGGNHDWDNLTLSNVRVRAEQAVNALKTDI
jgi:hypothetical protein